MVDFGQYTYQYRKPESYTLGPALRALREQNQQQERMDNQNAQAKALLGEQQAGRADENSRFAATFAADRSNAEKKLATEKYNARLKIGEAMHRANQAGDPATVEALAPTFKALGGSYGTSPGDEGMTDYDINEGVAPEQKAPDFRGTQDQIFGRQGPQMGKPFQMPSPTGPGGALVSNGEPFGPRENPHDSLPGMSAELAGLSRDPASPATPAPTQPGQPEQLGGGPALAPPPAPTPAETDLAAMGALEGAAEPEEDDGPVSPAPNGDVEWLDPEAEAEFNAQGLDVEQPPEEIAVPFPGNPFTPPAFSPTRTSSAAIARRNNAQNQPLQQAMEEGSPAGFQERAKSFNRRVQRTGYSPDRQAELTNPLFNQLVDMYQTETGAELAGQRMDNTAARQQQVTAQHKSDTFQKEKKVATDFGLKLFGQARVRDLNKDIQDEAELEDLIKEAATNGAAAYRLIAKNHDAADSGVLTKDDYQISRTGEVGWFERTIGDNWNRLIQRKGLTADQIDDIVEVSKTVSKRLHTETIRTRDKVYNLYKSAKGEAQREGLKEAIMGTFDRKYWPPEFIAPEPGEEQPGTYEPPAAELPEEDVGAKPLPATLDGSPKVSPSGTEFRNYGRVPPKPPRQPSAAERAKALLERSR